MGHYHHHYHHHHHYHYFIAILALQYSLLISIPPSLRVF
jgi:hypothetical protein